MIQSSLYNVHNIPYFKELSCFILTIYSSIRLQADQIICSADKSKNIL